MIAAAIEVNKNKYNDIAVRTNEANGTEWKPQICNVLL